MRLHLFLPSLRLRHVSRQGWLPIKFLAHLCHPHTGEVCRTRPLRTPSLLLLLVGLDFLVVRLLGLKRRHRNAQKGQGVFPEGAVLEMDTSRDSKTGARADLL